jgi:hypothetical protein
MTGAGFPHSEILESQPGCRLLEAYRRLQRPSSAPGTKTSTVCPYKLDTRHYMQNSADYRRCSRPLCSSQDTDGTMRRDPPTGRPRPQAVRVSALEKRLLPQDPTVCSEPFPPQALVPQLPRGEERTNRVARERKPNSQCSTRKHGRPVTRTVTRGAGAP